MPRSHREGSLESGQGWNFLQCGTEAIAELKLRAMEPSRSLTVLHLPSFSSFSSSTHDLLVASMDTSATTIEWILTELVRHPNVMKKIQNELEQVVGKNRMVEESDLKNLEYLDMVIKESSRLHPVAPLLIPHESIEDCEVDGFHIPKGSRLLINAWAIGRDPDIWVEPEKFKPERFQGSSIDLRGRHFELLPFGSGRRSCPGLQLGLTTVSLVLAQMVHCFDWELPDEMTPKDIDVTEKFGLVTTRAQHLMLIPNYRLHI
ncbi:hypothetical protein HAX54_028022 [Datura stramonium]|uniref:Cytochrome P450 n=1 Tax=Datura stramonium TaxID=4076 RepID=A0ABS8V5H5_DATST|nr:hypothetical protein [Datura stramonium]